MSDEDVAATAGLRRMVAHARNLLRGTQMAPPSGDWAYGKHWSPQQVQRYAAHILAEQTLTLVLDCLPQAELVSADEVADIRAKHAGQVAALRDTVKAREGALEQQGQEVAELRAERDEAVDLQMQSESVEAETFDKWQRAAELAKTDAAAAVRLLLAEDHAAEDGDMTTGQDMDKERT